MYTGLCGVHCPVCICSPNLYISLVSIWSLTIVTITRIIAITENIWSLRSSQLLKFDFHIVTEIIQIARHIRSLWSSRSLWSLCYDFHMIAGIVTVITIAAVTALVVSINFLRLLMIVHDCYDCRDRLWFYPSVRDRCNRWQSLGSLAITDKMKISSPYYDRYDRWTVHWWSQQLWTIANDHMETRLYSESTIFTVHGKYLKYIVKPGFHMIIGDGSQLLGSLVNCSVIVMIIWKPNFHFASDHQWSQRLLTFAMITITGIESESISVIIVIVNDHQWSQKVNRNHQCSNCSDRNNPSDHMEIREQWLQQSWRSQRSYVSSDLNNNSDYIEIKSSVRCVDRPP